MQQTDTTHFRHNFSFTRKTEREHLLSWPRIIFSWSDERGSVCGKLSIHGRKLSFEAADAQQSFSLKKKLWGNTWTFVEGSEQEFGKMHIGFPYSFSTPNGARFRIEARRRRFAGKSSLENPSLIARFSRDESTVMVLKNSAGIGFFSNEAFTSLEGVFGTDITDSQTIVCLLLFFQSYLGARNHSVT